MTDTPVIKIQKLTKSYRLGELDLEVLHGIDLSINPGEFVAIMGPSGSGKSTLMNILGCLDRPSTGHYLLDGEDVSSLDRDELAHIRNRRIGFIFQSFNLLSRTTALKNVMLPMLYSANVASRSEREEHARKTLEAVGLGDRVNHNPNALSGGQRQRVAIARALINDPSLILADEPTGNLDSRSGEEIMEILHEMHERGRTIVMVTHEPDIAQHTERIISLHDGMISSIKDSSAATIAASRGGMAS